MRAYRIIIVLLFLSALLAGCAQPEPLDELAIALTVAAVQTQNAVPQTQPTLAPTLTPAATPTPEKCLAQATQNNINLRRNPEGTSSAAAWRAGRTWRCWSSAPTASGH